MNCFPARGLMTPNQRNSQRRDIKRLLGFNRLIRNAELLDDRPLALGLNFL